MKLVHDLKNMMTSNSVYERFKINQQKLVGVLSVAREQFHSLGATGVTDKLDAIKCRVESERLKLLIVGEFKRGKSTLINALLGAEVLPAFAVPCTAVINEIKDGEEKSAIVHFHYPVPATLPKGLSALARQHIQTHRNGKDKPRTTIPCGRCGQNLRLPAVGNARLKCPACQNEFQWTATLPTDGNVPPLEIKIEDLEEYVVIPDPAKDHEESVAESPFRMVEIRWPITLCKDGVEIIDSPGLNEHNTRTNITVHYLDNVDAIVFVLSCQALCSVSEISFITNLRLAGHEDILFACNFFDNIRGNDQRQKVTDFARARLAPMTAFKSDGVFLVSARDALDGRLQNNEESLNRSGFLDFERRLANFLVESRGKVKLLQPARQVITEINKALNETVPSQRKMLQQTAGELEKRYEEIRPNAEQAKIRSRQVLDRLQRGREQLRMEVQDKLEMIQRQVADEVPKWAAAYSPKNEIQILTWKSTQTQAKALVTEVAEFLNQRISEEFGKWQRDILNPYVHNRLADMGEDVRETVDEIVKCIDEMKRKLTGHTFDEGKHPGGLERVLSAGAGLVLGGVGSMVVGGQLGFKEMLKSLVPAIATVAFGVIILGVTNPLILITMLLVPAAIQGLIGTKNITATLKAKCAESLAATMKDQSLRIAKEGATAIYEKTAELQKQIQAGLNQEMQSVTDLANSVLNEKRKGEAKVADRNAVLEKITDELRKAQSCLQDIVFDLAK